MTLCTCTISSSIIAMNDAEVDNISNGDVTCSKISIALSQLQHNNNFPVKRACLQCLCIVL